MSIANTRLSNWAQLMRACVATEGGLAGFRGGGAVAWSSSPGTIVALVRFFGDYKVPSQCSMCHLPWIEEESLRAPWYSYQ
jgi:hypothetical protein